MGESVLARWAAEIGLIANKSTEQDATGWDFILEWPVPLDTSAYLVPLDKIPAPMKCLVHLSAQTILAIEASIAKASPLDLSISYNNQHLGRGRIDPLQTVSPSLVKWAQMIESAWIVARHFSIEGKVEISAESLTQQNMALVLTSDYVMPEPRRLKISTWLNSPDLKTDAIWCVPFPTTVKLGKYKIQFAAGLLGEL